MDKYKAIIIDDELPARVRLAALTLKHKDKINIVAEADSGHQAIQMIIRHKPDLLFLDIHLPDMNGFEVLKSLDYHPFIIFTTAYQEYAIKAFEVYSVDYLVKPIEESRFGMAIHKLTNFYSSSPHQHIDYNVLAQAFHKSIAKPKQTTLAVKSGTKYVLIDHEDICFLKAEDKYVLVCTKDGKSYFCDKSLGALEENLPPTFLRAHRSYIIHQSWIAEIHRYFKGRLMLVMDDVQRTTIITSDSYTPSLKATLGI
ncbi:MAG: LytTR family DNA-binding domain-containing protein [Saprospiraceae bacterium]